MKGWPMRMAGAAGRMASRHGRVLLGTSAAAAVLPAPFLFACACTCGSGGVPSVLPEAPWQPLVLVAGAAGTALWWRRRSRAGPVRGERRAWRPARQLMMLIARSFTVLILMSVAVGVASAAVVAATPQVAATAQGAATAPPCDCDPTPSGGVQGTATVVSTPSVGVGAEALRVGVPLVVGGVVLVGASVLVRPRRRRKG